MKRSRTRAGYLATVTLLLASGLPGCSEGRADGANPEGAGAVRRGEFVRGFLLTGELEAVRSEEIQVPRVPSWQTTIRWMEEDGARVREGQKVLEFDNSTFAGSLDERRLQRDKASSDLDQKKAEVVSRLAGREFQVEQARIAREKAAADAEVPEELISRRTWQERQLALARAEVAWNKAVEDLEAARVAAREEIEQLGIALEKASRDIESAERAIDELVLHAPTGGILVVADHPWEGRKFQTGDSVWVGLTVVRIPDLREMRVTAWLSDVDDGKIAPGMPVECTLDAYPDGPFPGRIEEITPVAQEPDRRSLRRTFKVAVGLDRSDPDRMRPGMSVKVEVEAARLEDVLLAPRDGIDFVDGAARARLAGGGTAEVELGPCNASECVVEAGLEEGDRLEREG